MRIPALAGLSGNVCPDHFYVANIQECLPWAQGLDMLVYESAGLCKRSTPKAG